MVRPDNIRGFGTTFAENKTPFGTTLRENETTLIENSPKTLSRVGLRCRECDFRLRRPRMRDRLDSSLKLWLSRGKQKDDLLEPVLHLAEGEKLVKDFGPSLSREQTDYIYASIAEQKRRKQDQARIRYAVMAAVSLLAILAGFQLAPS